MEYKVVEAIERVSLEKQVNYFLKKGWSLFGGVRHSSMGYRSIWYQTLLKYEYLEDEWRG
jgi:hypothetical protein